MTKDRLFTDHFTLIFGLSLANLAPKYPKKAQDKPKISLG